MEPDFWHERWSNNQIGFHEGETNALLKAHFQALDLAEGSRIFLPLCGKTRDIAWLLDRGHRVVGVELSADAIRQLFEELGQSPVVTETGRMSRYTANRIDVFVGDFFDLTEDQLGPVDAVYDRAALVALPGEMRANYAAHLTAISKAAPQFLITFAYDQSQMEGPPFSVPGEEVRRLYEARYAITDLTSKELSNGLKGQVAATEDLWLLKPR